MARTCTTNPVDVHVSRFDGRPIDIQNKRDSRCTGCYDDMTLCGCAVCLAERRSVCRAACCVCRCTGCSDRAHGVGCFAAEREEGQRSIEECFARADAVCKRGRWH